MDQVARHMEITQKKHREFFNRDKAGDMLVFVNCWKAGSADINFGDWQSESVSNEPIIEMPSPLSEDFLHNHAFDMGVEAVREARLVAEFHSCCLQDDWCPQVIFHPGAGYQAAMSANTDLIFVVGTNRYGASYIRAPIIDDFENVIDVFSNDNRWIDYAIDFWRGVETQNIEIRGPYFARRSRRSTRRRFLQTDNDTKWRSARPCPRGIGATLQ